MKVTKDCCKAKEIENRQERNSNESNGKKEKMLPWRSMESSKDIVDDTKVLLSIDWSVKRNND